MPADQIERLVSSPAITAARTNGTRPKRRVGGANSLPS
jgi:hypothetical protein